MGSGQTKVKKVSIKNEVEDTAKRYVRDEVNDYDDRDRGSDSGHNTDRDAGRTTGNHRDNNAQNKHSRSSNNHKSGSKNSKVEDVRRATNQNSGRGGPNKGTKSQQDRPAKSGEFNKLPDISENNYVFGDGRETNTSSVNARDNLAENGRHGGESSGRRGSRGSNDEGMLYEDIEDLENPDRERRNRYQDEYDDDDDDDDDYNVRSSRTHRDRLNIEREKIETHLRSSRVPETKVRGLALRLSQVYSEPETPKPFEWEKTVRILRKVIHNGLDPIVLGSRKKTNLDSYENDPEELAQKVSEMVHQVERDLGGCKEELNIDEDEENGGTSNHGNKGRNTSKDTSPYKQGSKGKNSKGNTSGRGQKDNKRNNQEKPGKPTPVVIQNGIRELHTQYDILQDRYAQVLKEKIKLERADASNREKADVYFEESKRLEVDLRKIGEDAGYLNETLGKAKSQETKLRQNVKTLQEEKKQLAAQNKDVVDTVRGLTRELNKLQDDNSYLQTENATLRGEMHKLQGPDKKTVAQVQELKQQVLELTAQTRRLEGEKGTLRGNYQKLEAAMDAVQTERKELSRHRENLLRDKRELETANKRLILSGGDIRDI